MLTYKYKYTIPNIYTDTVHMYITHSQVYNTHVHIHINMYLYTHTYTHIPELITPCERNDLWEGTLFML